MNIIYKVIFNCLLVAILFISQNSINAQVKNPRNIDLEWETDLENRSVALEEITLVVPRNTFPAIDYPAFLDIKEGTKRFYENEPVISVQLGQEAKAYPLNMLTMHEMSNDWLAGVPILPTYCPLCNASVVFDRRVVINGIEQLLEFEVSGLLRNSDMIMADRQTQTWWQQLTGEAIVGDLTGTELDVIPSQVMSVKDFFAIYPDGKILSPDTNTRAADRYGRNPYEGYDGINNKPFERFFDHQKVDSRLPPMERVVDIEVMGKYKVYPFSAISVSGVINDLFEDQPIVVFFNNGPVSVLDDGQIDKSKTVGSAAVFFPVLDGVALTFEKNNKLFIDNQTGSVWDFSGRCVEGKWKGSQLDLMPHSNHFAFAWLAFHPETEIFQQP